MPHDHEAVRGSQEQATNSRVGPEVAGCDVNDLPAAVTSPSSHEDPATNPTHAKEETEGRLGDIFTPAFLTRLKTTILAREMLPEERANAVQLRSKYGGLNEEYRQTAAKTQEAIEAEEPESAELMVHLRLREAELRQEAAVIREEFSSCQRKLEDGDGVVQGLKVDLLGLGKRCLEEHGILRTGINMERLRMALCSDDHDGDQQAPSHIASKANGDDVMPAEAVNRVPKPEASAKRQVEVERAQALHGLVEAEQRFGAHRGSYRVLRMMHIFGQRPDGFDEWYDSWSDTQFDVRHRKQGASLAKRIADAEERLQRAFEQAQEEGLEPLECQRFHFPDHASEGRDSQTLPIVPSWRAEKWLEGLPERAQDPGTRSARPGDVDVQSLEEVGLGDSHSCVAERKLHEVSWWLAAPSRSVKTV